MFLWSSPWSLGNAMSDENVIHAIRQAVELNPESLPLRRHLAETLLAMGHCDAAQKAFRAALLLAPDDDGLKRGLARAFAAAGKTSAALVVVEDLLKQPAPGPDTQLLYARLLRHKDTAAAAGAYRRAVQADPALADPMLARQLGESSLPPEAPILPFDNRDPSDDAFTEEHDTGPAFAEIVEEAELTVRDEFGLTPTPPRSATPPTPPDVTFADVGGLETIKNEIAMKILLPARQPELFQAYGKKSGGSILLFGPPGCGKTHLARATAGEMPERFTTVLIPEVLDMWIGASEHNLHVQFERARDHAPGVLFFDEVDALAASRTDAPGYAGRQLASQFLSELDGMNTANDGLLVLAATNAPWLLDWAFLRPGRFGRILFVPPPDTAARADILRLLLRGKPTRDIDHDAVAHRTEHFSGADLSAVVELAVETRLRDAARSGEIHPLTTRDLLTAASRRKPTTRDWFATARLYATHANSTGLYDPVLEYLNS